MPPVLGLKHGLHLLGKQKHPLESMQAPCIKKSTWLGRLFGWADGARDQEKSKTHNKANQTPLVWRKERTEHRARLRTRRIY